MNTIIDVAVRLVAMTVFAVVAVVALVVVS
jgi:hypothetical protein